MTLGAVAQGGGVWLEHTLKGVVSACPEGARSWAETTRVAGSKAATPIIPGRNLTKARLMRLIAYHCSQCSNGLSWEQTPTRARCYVCRDGIQNCKFLALRAIQKSLLASSRRGFR